MSLRLTSPVYTLMPLEVSIAARFVFSTILRLRFSENCSIFKALLDSSINSIICVLSFFFHDLTHSKDK